MDLNIQRQKAEAFRQLHDRSRILVLANVWDAMSARAVEEAGGRAIATSSATLSHSIGYADGDPLPAPNSSPRSPGSRAPSTLRSPPISSPASGARRLKSPRRSGW